MVKLAATAALCLAASSLFAEGLQCTVTHGAFRGTVDPATGAISMEQASGQPVHRLLAPSFKTAGHEVIIGKVVSSTSTTTGLELVQSAGETTIATRLSFAAPGVLRYEVTDWNGQVPSEFQIDAESSSTEHFYGFGEKFNSLDQAGKLVHTMTFDQPGEKGDASYKVAPWYVSSNGYGFHLDNSAESWFDMRHTDAARVSVRCLGSRLACNIVAGPKPKDVLTRFTGYTGRTPLSPRWVFAPWISSDIWHNGGEVRYVVSKLRELNIPTSVFVFDSPWEIGYNDFTWNMKQFGDPGTYEGKNYEGFPSVHNMMEFFRSNGMKVVVWMTPLVNITSNNDHVSGQNTGKAANYDEGAANNYFVRTAPGGSPLVVPWWKGTGSPVDFTNPSAARWFMAQLTRLVDESRVKTSSGISEPVLGGFKTDDGESGNAQKTYIPKTASYFDGRTGEEMQNGYCVGYHKTVWNVLGTSGALFARSGFTGTQSFPVGWAGDNEGNFSPNGLPGVIVAALSSAMSGQAMWASDVGGYEDHNFPDVAPEDAFMRWTQFGAFSPVMQMHRQVHQNHQYPWSYGPAALANYLFYARLHTDLFPYIYASAKQAEHTGVPIMRPLVLENPEDANAYANQDEYYFGDAILVAPICTAQSTTRTVYLPRGTWHDFWTSATYTGGQNITWHNADPTKFPVFVKNGSIVPMLLSTPQTLCSAEYINDPLIKSETNDLRILMHSAEKANVQLVDGTQIEAHSSTQTVSVSIKGPAREVEFDLYGSKPGEVKWAGAVLAPAADSYHAGWFYDSERGVVSIRGRVSASTIVEVSTAASSP